MCQRILQALQQRYSKTDIENKVDQVVALIFRSTPSHELEILFLQRAYSQADHYSGDLCLPGGYREKGETCIETAIRETMEETALQLTNYIGTLQFVFTTRIGRSRVRGDGISKSQLYMGILVFQIDYIKSQTIKLQEKQIRAYKWIPIKKFLKGDNNKLINWPSPYFIKPTKKIMVLFPAMEIGMDRQLYGLTLYIMMLFVVTIEELHRQGKVKLVIDNSFFENFCRHCTDLRVQGNNEEEVKIARKLYLENRVGFLKSKL